jgi:predicted Zn-dependent peptidase
MTRLAKNEIYFGRHLPPEETVTSIEAVSGEEIRQLAGEIFNADKVSLAALGKVSDHVITKDLMRF